jgi:hypothetical protein
MATTTSEQHFGALGDEHDRRFARALAAGTTWEALAGAAALALAIIGLAGMAPTYMMPIGVILVGAAFLMEAAAMRSWDRMAEAGPVDRLEAGNDFSAQMLGAAAGIVLGILALIGVVPQILCASAILVFGACLLVTAGRTAHARQFTTAPAEGARMIEVKQEANPATSGAKPLVALAAIVLGILAIVNIAALPLTLVGVLILGASFVIDGSAMSTQWFSGFSWTH